LHRHPGMARAGAGRRGAPLASRVLLYTLGGLGLFAASAALFGESEPGRAATRITGGVVFGVISGAAVVAAYLLGRRPRAGRGLGIAAAAGGLFLGWLVAVGTSRGLGTVLIGIAIVVASGVIAWQLWRWRLHGSAEAEDGSNVA